MDFKAVLKKRMLEEASGSTEDSLKAAVTSLEKAKEANKKIQDQGTAFMEKFALTPTELSAWPDDLKQKLEAPGSGPLGHVAALPPGHEGAAERPEPLG